MVGEGLELAAVGLAGAPHVAHGLRAVAGVGHAVHQVVLGLVLEAAVVVQRPGAGPRQDVVLEEVLACGHVAVEEVGAAHVGPAVPHQVVVEADVAVAPLLEPRLVLVVAVVLVAGLDAAEVVGDADTEVVDVVVLHIGHVVRVALTQNIFYKNNI